MIPELAVPNWLALVTVLVLAGLVVAVVRLNQALQQARDHADEVLASAASDAEALRQQLVELEERLSSRELELVVPDRVPVATVDDREYVITDMAQSRGPRIPVKAVPAPQFADVLLRESVIKTAALAAGLARALAPEVRNRIRFEMRRDVKRSRRDRKLMLKAARRDWEARGRSEVEDGR